MPRDALDYVHIHNEIWVCSRTFIYIYIHYIYKHLSIYLKNNLLCLLYNYFKHHFQKTLKNPILMNEVQTIKHPTRENTPHGSIAFTPSDQNKSNDSRQLVLVHTDWGFSRSLAPSNTLLQKKWTKTFLLQSPPPPPPPTTATTGGRQRRPRPPQATGGRRCSAGRQIGTTFTIRQLLSADL